MLSALLSSLETKLLEISDEFDMIDFFKVFSPIANTQDLNLNLDLQLIIII